MDARNELDTVAYQVERRLSELGEAVPEHERARANMLVGDAREALKNDDTQIERLRSLTAELQSIYHSVGSSPTGGATGGAGRGGDGGGSAPGGAAAEDSDDVIDAEFTSG